MAVRAIHRVEAKLSSTADQKFDEEIADFDAVTPAWDNEADFEEGDTSDFDAVSGTWDKEVDALADFDAVVDADGDMNNEADAAHDGAVGLEITFDDANAAYGDMDADAVNQTAAVLSFWFDKNTLAVQDTKYIDLIIFETGAPANSWGVRIYDDSGDLEMQLVYWDDAPAVQTAGARHTIATGYNNYKVVFDRSSAGGADDGWMQLYVNDALIVDDTGHDNDTQDWDNLQAGMVSTDSGTFAGTYYLDTLKVDPVGQVMADQLAAHDGDYGLTVNFNDGTVNHGTLNADAIDQTTGIISFWFNPNSVAIENTKIITIGAIRTGAPLNIALITVRNNGGTYQMRLRFRDDAGVYQNGSYINLIDDWQKFDVMFAVSTGVGNDDGFARLYIDDVLEDSIIDIDNDTRDWDSINMGLTSTTSTTFGGFFYLDTIRIDPVGGPMVDILAVKNGTYGLVIPIMETTARYGSFTNPTAEIIIGAECWLDPNLLTMGANEEFTFMSGDVAADFYVNIKYSSGYFINITAVTDAGSESSSDYSITDEMHHIRIVWAASTGAGEDNGYLRLYIDGVLQEALTGLDNDTKDVGNVEFGAITGLDAGTFGIFYLDDCLWGPWDDISLHVIGNITGHWGMMNNGHLDLLADTGETRLILNNASGKYSPGLSGSITNFKKGTPVRLIITYSELDYKRFYGTIDDIDPDIKGYPGPEGDKVLVIVTDWIDYSATHPLISPSIQANKRGDEMLTTIVADMPIAPQATDYDTGINTFDTAFDTMKVKTKAYSEMSKIAFSEIGPIYLTKDPVYGETLVFESAEARNGLRTPDYVADNDMVKLSVSYGENVVNRFANIAYPRYVDSGISVLFSLGAPLQVGSGVTLNAVRGNYTDPSGGSAVAGANMINPVVTTDYLMNTKKDGSGANISADLTVTPAYGAAGVTYSFVNANTAPGWITFLRARGYIVFNYNQIEKSFEDSDSYNEFGYQPLTLQQKYQYEITQGALKGAAILEQEKQPRKKLDKAHFVANRTDGLMLAWLTRDIGDLVHIQEDKTGIDEYAYIQGIIFSISPGGVMRFTWILKGMLSLDKGLSLISCEFDAASTDALNYGYLPQVSEDGNDNRSISLWIYAHSVPDDPSIAALVATYLDAGGLLLGVLDNVDGNERVGILNTRFPTVGIWSTDDNTFELNTWTNIILTYNLTAVAADPIVYVGGVSQNINEAQAPVGALISEEGAEFLIGNAHNISFVYTLPFDGVIKDVRVYDVILTQAEATSLAASGNVTRGMVYQGPCVRTAELASFEDLVLTSDQKMIDNMYGVVGTPNNTVTTRLIP